MFSKAASENQEQTKSLLISKSEYSSHFSIIQWRRLGLARNFFRRSTEFFQRTFVRAEPNGPHRRSTEFFQRTFVRAEPNGPQNKTEPYFQLLVLFKNHQLFQASLKHTFLKNRIFCVNANIKGYLLAKNNASFGHLVQVPDIYLKECIFSQIYDNFTTKRKLKGHKCCS